MGSGVDRRVRRWRIVFVQAVLVGLLGSLLPLVPAAAGSISLTADSWSRNESTGLASFQLTLNTAGLDEPGAPCEGYNSYCTWYIDAYHIKDGVQTWIMQVGSEQVRNTGGNLTIFTKTLTSSSSEEITDFRARVVANTNGAATWYSNYAHVADPLSGDGLSLTKNIWTRADDGTVTYDLLVEAQDAARRLAPCDNTCTLYVHAYFKDATSHVWITDLKYEYISGGVWTFARQVTGSRVLDEITHVRARLVPGNTSTHETWDTGLIEVMPQATDGGLTMNVKQWQRDAYSGNVTFDLEATAHNAARRNGPCDATCYLYFDAYYKNGTTQAWIRELKNYTVSGLWNFSRSATGSDWAMDEVTHVRARLVPGDKVKYETWDTGLVQVLPPASGSVDLVIRSWSKPPSSSSASYDVSLMAVNAALRGGPCDNACSWEIHAYKDMSGTKQWLGMLGSGTATNLWTFERKLASTTSLSGVTHLRAVLNGSIDWLSDFKPVADPTAVPQVDVQVKSWLADEETGFSAYDLDLSATGAASSGAPCATDCTWKIEASYLAGESNLQTLDSGSVAAGNWVFTRNALSSGKFVGEVTHIRGVLENAYGTKIVSGWKQVGSSLADGDIQLSVNSWERDAVTGTATYDLTLAINRAGQADGPCRASCYWKVDAYFDDGTQRTLVAGISGGSYPAGVWSTTEQVVGSVTLASNITHLKGELKSSDGTGQTYEDWAAGGLVSDFMLADIDVAPLAGFLAANNISKLDFCLTVEERARILRIPDATPSTSTHYLTEVCDTAASVRAALVAIAAVVGGAPTIGAIIDHYIGGDPNADSIAKVAALPEPASAGSGFGPPTSCLSDVQKAAIEADLAAGDWVQDHHAATNKGSSWPQLFKDLLAQYPYAADKSLSGGWNIVEDLLHRGTHPPAYHFWAFRNMEKALRESTSWTEFEQKWNEWVKNVIRDDPTIIRWEWWRC